MNSPSTSAQNTRNGYSNSNHKKKFNNILSYFAPPPFVKIPHFPVPKDLPPVVSPNLQSSADVNRTSMQYRTILDKIKNCPEFRTKESNHLQILKVMLYLEEIQNHLDMKRYNLNDKFIELYIGSSVQYKIGIEELKEDFLRPGDVVEIWESGSRLASLRVTSVTNKYILASTNRKFDKIYNQNKTYNISFRYQNYTLRCNHLALYFINLHQLTPYFFPIKRSRGSTLSSDESWFNESIKSNGEQKQAVLNILGKSSFPAPYILYGPPGTGKTATLVEAICQVWQKNPSDHILVCTPSNGAADVITKRLLKYIPKNHIYRMYSPSKNGSEIDKAIVDCSNSVEGEIMMLPKELIIEKRIVILTLCACTRLLFLGLKENHFSYVFIDEAGQATEPETMIPFNLLSSNKTGKCGILHGQVIVAGDPQQLGPGIRSKLAEPILGKSLLERLMECEPYRRNEYGSYDPSYITKLLKNYRSHPAIIQISNELFYDNELIACENIETRKAEKWCHLVNKNFPIIFHGIEGKEMKFNSTSCYNDDEIKIVREYVTSLLKSRMNNREIKQEDIGIITPFAAQKGKLKNALAGLKHIDVGTVELLQGQEKDIIILSTVRSKTFCHNNQIHIGFLSNPKRFNVALTRAKSLLIIVGNPIILQTDKHWRYLLDFCKRNNACCGLEFNIPFNLQMSLKELQIFNNRPKDCSPAINDSALEVIQIDEGVYASSDEDIIDENEYRDPVSYSSNFTVQFPFNENASNYRSSNTPEHNKYKSVNTPEQHLLSDVIVIKTEYELKREKQAAKKNKKMKNKSTETDEIFRYKLTGAS